MKFKVAFLFIVPDASPELHNSHIETPSTDLTIVGVSTYTKGVETAKELAKNGVQAIELCAGYGTEGVAMIKEAVGPNVLVGVVRFDNHPAFDFKSGDELFQ